MTLYASPSIKCFKRQQSHDEAGFDCLWESLYNLKFINCMSAYPLHFLSRGSLPLVSNNLFCRRGAWILTVCTNRGYTHTNTGASEMIEKITQAKVHARARFLGSLEHGTGSKGGSNERGQGRSRGSKLSRLRNDFIPLGARNYILDASARTHCMCV
jgi:hypothetical protein